MARALIVPALAMLFSFAPTSVAGAVEATEDAPAPITAALDKNANVRFGPTTSSKVVVTLKSGDMVEVFGPSKSSAEWYVIRFPKQGRVWVHTKNLAPLDGGARYKVVQDKTRARNDATLSADVVAELSLGEVVEDKGQVVGDWRAVNIPDAVAYVHKSLLKLPPNIEKLFDDQGRKAEVADQAWQKAMATYTQFIDTVKASPKAAVGLDWASLAGQLDIVTADHASASVRNAAKRVRDSIAALVPVAQQVAPTIGQTPPASLPDKPTVSAPVADPIKPVAAPDPAGPKPLSPEDVDKLIKAKPVPSIYQAEGMLVQDDQYSAKVGTRDLLQDGDGNVLAFIKAKDGVDLKLSELQWREVGAKGEIQMIAPEQSGLTKPVKLIVATDVAPLRR